MSIAVHLMLCLAAAAAPGRPEPIGGEYGRPRVVVPAPSNPRYAHLGWPKIVSAPDGTLVLAYSAGRAHSVDGCPAVSLSTDRGRSFTEPHVLQNFDGTTTYRHCGNLALGVAEDGAVVLLAMAFTGNTRNTIYGWRSSDSGKTWQPADTSSLADNRTGSVYGHVFPVPGKGLAVCGHYRRGSRPQQQGIWIAFSNDHGRSWGRPQAVTGEPFYEPAVVFAEGRLIGLFRLSAKASRYWQAVSDDLGATWRLSPGQIAADLPERWRLPSPFVAVSPRDPSRLYALESQRHVPGNVPGRIFLWTADAKTLNWQRRGLVAAIPKTAKTLADFAYPWMTPLDDETWFLVFYAGRGTGANSIYGMTLKPD